MKGFHKLVILGVVLVILLFVIDHIDAGKKQGKKKAPETEPGEEGLKISSKSSIKLDRKQKTGSKRTENYEEENQFVGKDSKFDKPNFKKNIKYASKDKQFVENENTKTTKHSQKLKKSKIVQEEPVEKFNSGKSKTKKAKPQYVKSENVDKIVKTVKKMTQKKLIEENKNVENISSEELNRMKNEETISIEESAGGNSKKRKYKLIEVVMQDDGEEGMQEENNVLQDFGLEDQDLIDIENEQNNAEYDDSYFNNTDETGEYEYMYNDGPIADEDTVINRYSDSSVGSCQKLPEDPTRTGPRKLTLYVVEKEINGQMRKRIVSEEDGVTMCEVADLLRETYAEQPEE